MQAEIADDTVQPDDADGLRAQAYWRGLPLLRRGLTLAGLQAFYARYKYLVMSRDLQRYRQLGRLLAAGDSRELPLLGARMQMLLAAALLSEPTRAGNVNALLHIRGYLKRDLDADQQRELGAGIDRYRRGAVPLAVPLALLRQHFRAHPNAYIERQLFMHCDEFSATAHDEVAA